MLLGGLVSGRGKARSFPVRRLRVQRDFSCGALLCSELVVRLPSRGLCGDSGNMEEVVAGAEFLFLVGERDDVVVGGMRFGYTPSPSLTCISSPLFLRVFDFLFLPFWFS